MNRYTAVRTSTTELNSTTNHTEVNDNSVPLSPFGRELGRVMVAGIVTDMQERDGGVTIELTDQADGLEVEGNRIVSGRLSAYVDTEAGAVELLNEEPPFPVMLVASPAISEDPDDQYHPDNVGLENNKTQLFAESVQLFDDAGDNMFWNIAEEIALHVREAAENAGNVEGYENESTFQDTVVDHMDEVIEDLDEE